MTARALKIAALCVVVSVTTLLVTDWLGTVEGQQASVPGAGFAAVPGQKGGQDVFGPYDPVQQWPRPLSESLPNHEGWTWSQATDVFPESADRVIVAQKGELPVLPAGRGRGTTWLPQIGPSLKFPIGGGVPIREAASATPSFGRAAADGSDGRPGVDWRWEHVIAVFDRNGRMVEDWSQWDKIWGRPHDVEISPYDPQKHVWIVDDHNHALFKFSPDGKQLVQTIGTPGKVGADGAHFNRPTFLAWLPDGTMFVADGYNGTRVAKFDRDGKFLLAWGQRGEPGGREMRPGYFNTVHGIAADPMTRRVYVSDRSNRRIQVFDENGQFVDQWPVGAQTNLQFLIIPADRSGIWGFTDTTARVAKWSFDGRLLYSWGVLGDFPGAFFNMHGASVDQEGNLYIAEVGGGRVQKFRPRQGANPAYLVGRPVYAAWK